MPLEIYQGTRDPAHRLTAQPESMTVYMVQGAQGVTFSFNRQEGAVAQDVPYYRVYVNEGGRDFTAEYAPPSQDAPALDTSRGPETTVAPSQGQWHITAHAENLSEERLQESQRAVTDRAPEGPRISLTVSVAGLDQYLVSFVQGAGNQLRVEHAVLEVRKRIRYHYREMLKPGQSEGGQCYSVTSLSGDVLEVVANQLGSEYGIDLQLIDEAVRPNNEELSSNNLAGQLGMPPVSGANARPPREMWIQSGGRIRASAQSDELAGLAITSATSINVRMFEETLASYRDIRRSWNDYRQAHNNAAVRDWLDAAGPLSAEDRELYESVAENSPDDIVASQVKATVLHELGHVFGLVPESQEAGAVPDSSWYDYQHSGHCCYNVCVMRWQIEQAGGLDACRMYNQAISFDGEFERRCSLFLLVAELADLRTILQSA